MNVRQVVFSTLVLLFFFFPLFTHGVEARVVLFVPGMSVDIKSPIAVWGEKVPVTGGRWTGMIGFFQQHGYTFGGAISVHKEAETMQRRSQKNVVFLLNFSKEAVIDGLGMKGVELAQALVHVKRLTKAKRVVLVCHSAGGLVARAYMQGGIAGVPYRGDVNRLITISTPHFGSSLAQSVGDYLGTRATSLQAGASLIKLLNDQLPLPDDVLYASVVVRGDLSDFKRQGKRFLPYIVKKRYEALPLSYRRGSDQVIHSVNQNLSLARTAAMYEQRTQRPVVYPLVVVPPPSRPAIRPEMNKIHNHAMGTEELQEMVFSLVSRDIFWQPVPLRAKSVWITREARLFAADAMTEKALEGRLFQGIVAVHLNTVHPRLQAVGEIVADFSGEVASRVLGIPPKDLTIAMSGRLLCKYDRFGRPKTVRSYFAGNTRGN